jgi:hypothetical protein
MYDLYSCNVVKEVSSELLDMWLELENVLERKTI